MALSELERAAVLRHQEAVRQVRGKVADYLGASYTGLGSWRDADIDAFVARIVPVVEAGQKQVWQLTSAYLDTLARAAGMPLAATGVPKPYGEMRLGASIAEVYRRPAVATYTALKNGMTLPDAVQQGLYRLNDLASTDLQLAQNHAAHAKLSASNIAGYRRVLTGFESCGLCVLASTQRYHKATLSPIHPGCVPGDAPVSARNVLAVTRRRYSGELTVITTADGDRVTVTANHPVLTEQGWVPAHKVRVGDYLLRSLGGQRVVGHGPHEGESPALAEDVWRAASVNGFARVPLSAEDFHGDGADGEVDIVWTDSNLAPIGDVSFGQPGCECGLVVGHRDGVALPALSGPAPLLERAGAASDGLVRCGGLSCTLLGSHPANTHDPSSRASAHGDVLLTKEPSDDVARAVVGGGERVLGFASDVPLGHLVGNDVVANQAVARFDAPAAEFSGESVVAYASQGRRLRDRLAGEVEPDRVVLVERVDASACHVYNLHTAEGWYESHNHIVSNCDCGIAPIFTEGGADPGQVINAERLDAINEAIAADSHAANGKQRLWSDVMVSEHGEYGPTLHWREQRFTGPSDI